VILMIVQAVEGYGCGGDRGFGGFWGNSCKPHGVRELMHDIPRIYWNDLVYVILKYGSRVRKES